MRDYQTDGQTHTGQSDPYVPLCFAGDTKTRCICEILCPLLLSFTDLTDPNFTEIGKNNKIYRSWIFFFHSSKFPKVITGFKFYCHFIIIQQAFWSLVTLFCENQAHLRLKLKSVKWWTHNVEIHRFYFLFFSLLLQNFEKLRSIKLKIKFLSPQGHCQSHKHQWIGYNRRL